LKLANGPKQGILSDVGRRGEGSNVICSQRHQVDDGKKALYVFVVGFGKEKKKANGLQC